MGEHDSSPDREPLIFAYASKTQKPSLPLAFVKSSFKRLLRSVMWAIFLAWIALIFLIPSKSIDDLYRKWLLSFTSGTFFGITGSMFLIFSGPILLLAFLSVLYLVISGPGEEQLQEAETPKRPRFRLWTFPVLVDGPFGVVSATELIGILLVVAYVIWATYAYTMQDLKLLSDYELPTMLVEWSTMLELTGLRFGAIGLYCLAFLFLPVARGSVLLRMIDIPFEHATRYHVWLGHLTMLLFTLHGLFYVVAWAMQGHLLEELIQWKDIGVANLAGVISLAAGLLMWVTSLSSVRKKYFELFFYTHQLYVVFVVFFALHVGDFVFSITAGGIFLFMLDRFLRFCQSRKTVDVISASCRPCGTIELILSKPKNLPYNALSFVFIQVKELSWLQWHPFSVSSTPMNGKNHLAVLIKVLGDWTSKLGNHICEKSEEVAFKEQSHAKLSVSVEGPYGHERPYHLMYENLILVAGGIGISPFLAVLSDILHRIKDCAPCRPRNVLLIWAIKRTDELPLLSAVDLDSIGPFVSDQLRLEISTYVTRQSEPILEEGGASCPPAQSNVFPVSRGCGMSVLVGTGHNVWSGIYIISSTAGFVILMSLLDLYYVNPYKISTWWYKGLLFIACMTASVLFFGGMVVGLWHLWGRSSSGDMLQDDIKVQHNKLVNHESSSLEQLASSNTIHYGLRPDFRAIFESVSERWGHVDVGVIVCGPATLQSSVAKECRSQNLKRRSHLPIFHFNSHSFDL